MLRNLSLSQLNPNFPIMRTTHKNQRKGFTLIELLTVIAIIGLLAGVLFSVGPAAMKAAQKSAASTSLKQIATSYINFAQGSGRSRNITEGSNPRNGQANSPALYAEVLARYADASSAKAWYIESDDALSSSIVPETVLSNIKDGTNQMQSVSPVSYAVVVNASKNLDDRYPIIWTRGLKPVGEWEEKSPWGKGGHIAFGDGHVMWYDNLNLDGNRLTNRENGNETSNYQEAIGTNARMKQDNP